MRESGPPLIGSACLIASWATVSGTDTQRPRSWRGWKARPWSIRLFGRTAFQSWTDASSAVKSTSSAAGHPASRIPSPESNSDTTTNAAPNRCTTPCESFPSVAPPWSSSRTCLPGFAEDGFDLSEKNYAEWVTRSKALSSSLRKRLARLTSGSESLCWPTAQANDSVGTRNATVQTNHPGRTYGVTLNDAIRMWATPDATAGQRGNGGYTEKQLNRKEGKPSILSYDVLDWATPAAQQSNGTPEDFLRRKREAVARGSSMGICLSDLQMQVMDWSTPFGQGHGNGPDGNEHSTQIRAEMEDWATPAGRDYKGSYSEESLTRKDGKDRENDLLPTQADYFTTPKSSLPAETDNSGTESSKPTRTSRPRLNPAFDCWLMGFPVLWTHPEPISCDALGMVAYRSALRSRLHGLLSGLGF